MTAHLRAFFALYIRPNNSSTGHTLFKLSTKRLVTTPKCKPKPMTEDTITVVNEIEKEEGMPDGIQLHYMNHESTLSNLYANEVGHNDNSYASDNNWNEKDRPEQDVSLIVDTNFDKDELEDIDDLGDEDKLHLGNGIADDEEIADNENQQDYFSPGQHGN